MGCQAHHFDIWTPLNVFFFEVTIYMLAQSKCICFVSVCLSLPCMQACE